MRCLQVCRFGLMRGMPWSQTLSTLVLSSYDGVCYFHSKYTKQNIQILCKSLCCECSRPVMVSSLPERGLSFPTITLIDGQISNINSTLKQMKWFIVVVLLLGKHVVEALFPAMIGACRMYFVVQLYYSIVFYWQLFLSIQIDAAG